MICPPPRISCSPSVLSQEEKKKMARATFPLLLLLLLLSVQGQSRLITDHSSPDPISDGIRHVGQHSLLLLERLSSNSSEACEQTYGFLPCTTTVLGNLFLVLVYGCLMFLAAKFLSTGSELLLELLGPGIVGGLFLPILGALPDALLILVSGLSGSKETAQHQVLIGMGLLAGSTVMLLTLLWGSCVIVGKCDLLDHSTSIDSQNTKRCSLTGSGVTTDLQTSHAAKIMAISVIPFIIVQVPLIFNLQSERRLGVLVGLIVAIAFLIAYCLYQVFQPWIQKRRLAYAKHKHVIAGILRHSEAALGRLLKDDGQPDTDVMEKLFERIDEDNNSYLSIRELTALIIGIKFDEIDLDRDDAVKKVMVEFDTSNDNQLSKDEFVSGLSKWVDHAKHSVSHATIDRNSLIHNFHQRTKEEHDMLIDRSDEVVESIDNPYWIYAKAISLLLLGAVIAAAFADPLVDAVTNFSNATSIPTFFISFIAMPLATNSSEAVSAIIFACRKKQRTTSLTFSEIYGGVTMNNILCLAVFLGLVYARHLTWDFSAEVLVILIVTVVMGLFTSFRTTFPLWTCAVAFIFYPFSLVLVYLLDYVFGWS